jgi:IS30 family transposase
METYRRLTRADRYQIERYLAAGKRTRWISDQLGFHRSNIYREINRGKIRKGIKGGKQKGEYSALEAHRRFKDRNYDRLGVSYKGYKIKGWVEDQIIIKLNEGWSPEQIAHRLKMEKEISISHEGIYKFILSCKKRGGELHKCLRLYRKRKRRFKRRNRYWALQFKRRKSIEDRPEEANQRIEQGHWERDLMLGKRKSGGGVLTIVDRKSHYTLLKRLQTTLASETNMQTAVSIKSSKLPCITLTNDNGHEFGEFWNLEKELDVPIYFTHPLCPWERGTVENTIGLLRQFIPKGTDLNQIDEKDISELQETINSRPRKALGFKTPHEYVTGKKQKLITKKRIETPPPEYYEQYYLTAEEIEEKQHDRRQIVALSG